MQSQNWFDQFLDWVRQLFGAPGIISQTLIYALPIAIVCTVGIILARRRRQEISRLRLRLLTYGCLTGIVFSITSILHALLLDSAISIQDFETIRSIYVLSLVTTLLITLSLALLIAAALVREPKLDDPS